MAFSMKLEIIHTTRGQMKEGDKKKKSPLCYGKTGYS
jgi:hypothetical protein